MTGKSLLVEDKELNRDMLTRRLNRAGLEVVAAGDGQEALDIMRQQQPTLVLMDMNLPVMVGWTACRHAREDEAINQIPIVRHMDFHTTITHFSEPTMAAPACTRHIQKTVRRDDYGQTALVLHFKPVPTFPTATIAARDRIGIVRYSHRLAAITKNPIARIAGPPRTVSVCGRVFRYLGLRSIGAEYHQHTQTWSDTAH